MENRPADNASRPKAGFSSLVRSFGISVGIAAFVIAFLVTYDIFTRSLFGMSNSWVTEICTYLMAYITFGGAAYALKEGAHVKVDLLLDMVSPAARWALHVASDGVMLVVVAVLAWLSFEFWNDAWSSGEKSPSLLAMPFWIPYLFFVLGMVWLLLALLTRTLGGVKRRKIAQGQGGG